MSSFSDDECSDCDSKSDSLDSAGALSISGDKDLRAFRLRLAVSGVCACGSASDSSDDEL